MKKLLYLFPLLLLSCQLFSQETIKIKEKVSKWEKYEYSVLKSDKKIKHGEWKKFNGKDLKESGFYKDNKKDSIWIKYNYQGEIISKTSYKNDKMNGDAEFYASGKLIRKGEYKDDVQVGIWEFYDAFGKVEEKYDYTTNRYLQFSPKAELTYKEVKDGDTTIIQLDQPVVYVDGMEALYNYIGMNFRYPQAAVENRTQGKVYVSFTIDIYGNIGDREIEKGLGDGLDEEAIRVLQSLPGKFSPAVVKGEAREIRYILPIVCRLN